MRLAAAFVGFALMALPAGAAPGLIDRLAGVYHQPDWVWDSGPDPDNRHLSHDVLEIVRVSSTQAYVRGRFIGDMDHICAFHHIAKVENDALVYRKRTSDNHNCVLTFKLKGQSLWLTDPDSICHDDDGCGARAHTDQVAFDLKHRRPIRYMPRLLASREYRTALEEAERK